MRVILSLMLPVLFMSTTASGQSLMVQGSGGPTIGDSGHSLAAGAGLSLSSRVTLLFDMERSHLSSRVTSDGQGGGSAFRGGTITFGAAEVRAALLPRGRVSPYLLGGVGFGVSRPNVNDTFPDPVTNNVRAFFLGGGIDVPLGQRVSVFGDARVIVGDEAGELLAIAPVRVGIAVRF